MKLALQRTLARRIFDRYQDQERAPHIEQSTEQDDQHRHANRHLDKTLT